MYINSYTAHCFVYTPVSVTCRNIFDPSNTLPVHTSPVSTAATALYSASCVCIHTRGRGEAPGAALLALRMRSMYVSRPPLRRRSHTATTPWNAESNPRLYHIYTCCNDVYIYIYCRHPGGTVQCGTQPEVISYLYML